MKIDLDPVWPWSWPWQILQEIPEGVGFLTLCAAVAAGVLAALWQAGRLTPRIAQGGGLALAAVFLLFARHAYEPVSRSLADSPVLGSRLALLAVLAPFALLLLPPLMAGLAAGSYFTAAVSPARRWTVLLLRLLAFLLALVALVRPATGWEERGETRSAIWVAVDASRSMQVVDEEGNRSRWQVVQQQWQAAQGVLDRLGQRGTDVRLVRFSDRIEAGDLQSEPDGATTDYGASLRELLESRDPNSNPKALLVVGDGTDLGRTALAEAARWRTLPCSLHTFSVGSENTSLQRNDVAITSITTQPQPTVAMKAPFTVRLTADAHGFENQPIQARLYVEDKENGGERLLIQREERLPLSSGNEITLTAPAPEQAGEYLLRVELQTAEPDANPANNRIETFLQVAKEGLRVLVVDRSRLEPVFIIDALRAAGVSVTPVWVRGSSPGKGVLSLDKSIYDVILIGDVAAEQLRLVDAQAADQIAQQVQRGAGLLLYGGYHSFGSGWRNTPLEPLLPIRLGEPVQDDTPTRMTPTDDGLRLAKELFTLEGGDQRTVWEKLEKLAGRSVLTLPQEPSNTDLLLAQTDKGQPLMVARTIGDPKAGATARVVAFGGDTTHRWVRDEDSKRHFERFWRQLVVWLSQQKESEGGVWVRPDAPGRRLARNSDLTFSVGVRAKGGAELLRGRFEASVTDPEDNTKPVPLSPSESETRGVYAETRTAGIYRIEVKGEAKDENGTLITGSASARVIVYDEDRETTLVAANPAFLKELAKEGGGESFRIEALAEVLERLGGEPDRAALVRTRHFPDWRTTERSGFLAAFLFLFCTVACLEWALRRLWGLV
jgi:uncharacterized membrane protein